MMMMERKIRKKKKEQGDAVFRKVFVENNGYDMLFLKHDTN